MGTHEEYMERKIERLVGKIDRRKYSGIKPQPTSSYAPYSGNDGGCPAENSEYRQSNATDSDGGAISDASGSSWITRTDRHLQLINSSAYKGSFRLRPRQPEMGRIQRPRHKAGRGRAKNRSLLHQMEHAGQDSASPTDPELDPTKYTIAVEGIRFSVANGGKKLVKLPGQAEPTPMTAFVSGAKFKRTASGNLERDQWQGNHTAEAHTNKLDVPCKQFSTTGSCPRGPRCRFQHDEGKVSICKSLLLHGACPLGESCDLSHEPTPERVPTCVHYAKGLCSKADCMYAHVDLAPDAQYCRPFGLYGYCKKGADCAERHSFECPDFADTGVCNTKGCKLVHRERASVLRRATAANDSTGNGGASSEEQDELSDIDSDEIDERVIQDETIDNDFIDQRDYIGL